MSPFFYVKIKPYKIGCVFLLFTQFLSKDHKEEHYFLLLANYFAKAF